MPSLSLAMGMGDMNAHTSRAGLVQPAWMMAAPGRRQQQQQPYQDAGGALVPPPQGSVRLARWDSGSDVGEGEGEAQGGGAAIADIYVPVLRSSMGGTGPDEDMRGATDSEHPCVLVRAQHHCMCVSASRMCACVDFTVKGYWHVTP